MDQVKSIEARYQQREAELHSLLLASRAVLKYSSFQKSARAIFDQAKQITRATAGYVALLSEDGQENELLFLDAGGLKCEVDPELPMPIRGLRAQSYQSGKPVFHNDFMHTEWTQFLPEGHVDMRNVMFAPLNIEGKTVGLMGLANKPGDFTERDAEMAEAFAEFAAIALYNSRNLDKLRDTVAKLTKTLQEVKTLKGIVPICANCKKIRDDDGFWNQLEAYLYTHTEADLSHGICPDCMRKLYPDYTPDKKE